MVRGSLIFAPPPLNVKEFLLFAPWFLFTYFSFTFKIFSLSLFFTRFFFPLAKILALPLPSVDADHHLLPLPRLLWAGVHRGVESLADLLHAGLQLLSLDNSLI